MRAQQALSESSLKLSQALSLKLLEDTEQAVAQPTPEEEARLAKQAFKPQAYVIEIVEHMSDEELREQ